MTKLLCWFGHKWERIEGEMPQWVMGVCFDYYKCLRCQETGWFRQGWFDPPSFIKYIRKSKGRS